MFPASSFWFGANRLEAEHTFSYVQVYVGRNRMKDIEVTVTFKLRTSKQ